ncbi:MAG: valine--tRNA ligase [Chloroflexi bacterium]|nr:valine--tRNA ligase [Chloroflexota bacterium]
MVREEDRATAAAKAEAEQMDRAYHPADVEPRIYERWLAADVFPPDGRGTRADLARPPFVIVQPPPNVTGALHLGHALTAAVEDLMIRRARMQGRPTLWLPGVDHASIAAQFVLDRMIAEEGESRASLGRDRYLERMRAFVEETRGTISGQHRRLGASADWKRERFTMDDGSAKAVRVAFKRLYDDGLAYRGERLINWCPGCKTSLSDLEVLASPETGTLWSVRYHVIGDDGTTDPDKSITVATTRPETILGDTAVAVHPDDDRYSALVGKRVLIPFVDRVVPIIADAVVKRDFGTGAVKITPAHDPEDYETGLRHQLPTIDVMTDDGRMNDDAGPLAGLAVGEARNAILADLKARGDLAAETAHEMIIGRCQRSDDIVEPRLKVQWFISVKPMAGLAMTAVRDGRTRFVPKRFEKVFFDWMENIRDWNVSRQLWWGHRIPAWYCPDGHITVSDAADGPSACTTCARGTTELTQDEDIFDTWFSSGLWPFSTLGWPDQTPDLARFYPGSVMETGYDIIFFWVARMMMLGGWLTGQAPFGTVYLHGMVRDPYGAKMSKTQGNVIDPLSVIDEYGADALRFALVNGGTPGADQRLGASRLEGARNFANKIWNAARFVLGARPEDVPVGQLLELPVGAYLGPAEHWILGRCAETVESVERAYATFQFSEVTRLLYDAIWSDYCDWYLELSKVRLESEHPPVRQATWLVLAWVLERYLRLLHPVMPFLTEELWTRFPHQASHSHLLMIAPWPDALAERGAADEARAAGVGGLIELITGIRTARSEARIEPQIWLAATVAITDPATKAAFGELTGAFERLARVRVTLVDALPSEDPGEATLTVLTQSAEARLAKGGADLERDRQRLRKELSQAERQLAEARARLADERFASRAPEPVVAGVRSRASALEERVARLRARTGD